MKVLTVVGLVAVLSVLALPASANNLNVIFDPTPTPAGGGTNLYYLTNEGPWSVSWQPCQAVPGGPLPPSSPLIGDVACLGFANYTNADINSLNLTFTASGALDGLVLNCSNVDSYLNTNNCATYSSPLTDGEVVNLTFSGPLDVPANFDFFFGVTSDSSALTGMPDSTITLPTHDPGTLLLLASGIALLALCGLRRRAGASLAS